MGYTTDFSGRFELSQPLTEAQAAYLAKFSETRRMKRDGNIALGLQDPVRVSADLPIGQWAEYFVGASGDFGQGHDASIIDYNMPPPTQPGLWCQWIPTEDRAGVEWNGMEKFYHYEEWLNYLAENFLKRWGVTLSGAVGFQGEASDDFGELRIENGRVIIKSGVKFIPN